jgi:hypothetical protein
MFRRSACRLAVSLYVMSCSLFGQQPGDVHHLRDAQAIEVLARTLQAAGGGQALASVHDITESGEITFYWGKDVKGPITIRALGGNHFRMEADLPEGKSTWIVKDGVGSKKESEKVTPISRDNAVNLGNLTYPVGHVVAALADSASDVSFVGIEKRAGRSIYRLRVKGQLGLVSQPWMGGPVVKELLIDALTFDIVSVEDHPMPTRNVERRSAIRSAATTEKRSDPPSRVIEFADFRVVKSVRLPFSVSTKLLGQETMSIRLDKVIFNSDLGVEGFEQ